MLPSIEISGYAADNSVVLRACCGTIIASKHAKIRARFCLRHHRCLKAPPIQFFCGGWVVLTVPGGVAAHTPLNGQRLPCSVGRVRALH